jgi:hypothetical protein
MENLMKLFSLLFVSVMLVLNFADNCNSDTPKPLSELEKDKIVAQICDKINMNAPKKIDNETLLINAIGSSKKIIYNMRIVNKSKKQLAATSFSKKINSQISSMACSNPSTINMVNNLGINMEFVYYDKSNQYVTNVIITKASCIK